MSENPTERLLAAAKAASDDKTLDAVRDAATDHASRVSTLFYVDTLEFLRRGGRIGAASALLGTALSVKPILHVVDGAILCDVGAGFSVPGRPLVEPVKERDLTGHQLLMRGVER